MVPPGRAPPPASISRAMADAPLTPPASGNLKRISIVTKSIQLIAAAARMWRISPSINTQLLENTVNLFNKGFVVTISGMVWPECTGGAPQGRYPRVTFVYHIRYSKNNIIFHARILGRCAPLVPDIQVPGVHE